MKLVKLSPDEWRRYRDIRLEALRREPSAFAASYESARQKPDEFWIGRLEASHQDLRQTLMFVESYGELIAMIGAYPVDDTTELISLYVQPDRRGNGIGEALVEALMRELRPCGEGHEVRLTVHARQEAAYRLYLKCGFEVSRIDNRPPPNQEELEYVMSRRVTLQD